MSDLFKPAREIERLCKLHNELKPDASKYSATAFISETKKVMVDPERRPIEWIIIDLKTGDVASVFDVDLAPEEFSIIKSFANSLKAIRAEAY